MPGKDLPVYNIEKFGHHDEGQAFYANTFSAHLRHHHFVNTPHKHDCFLVILFTKGHGTHDIDFNTYAVKPGTVFVLSPGQPHSWALSKDTEGYVFFHTRDFYDLHYTSDKIHDYPFFRSLHHSPMVALKKKRQRKMTCFFEDILEEYGSGRPMKPQKLLSLITLFYIELSRLYLPGTGETIGHQHYLDKVRKLESLIGLHYKTVKSPNAYAGMMNVSERHLNRMSKACLQKTVSDLVAERVLLEAKRMLVNPGFTVAEVAEELGYPDPSYFSRLFKKKYGSTPTHFASHYR